MMKTKDLFELSYTAAKPLLETATYPWEALPQIGSFIRELIEKLDRNQYEEVMEDCWVEKTANLYPNIYISGPAVIGPNTEVRPGAFLRGNTLIGANCVVGNSTELKNVILFDNVQVPHYNYVGDSILGYKAHMGAGAITSNVKQDKSLVKVNLPNDKNLQTELKKFGAMIGDNAEIGCNTVMNPGTVIGKNARVYPLSMVRGFVEAGTIYKNNGERIQIL